MTIFSVTDYLKFCKVFTYLKLFGKGLFKNVYMVNICMLYDMSETYVLYTIWVKSMYYILYEWNLCIIYYTIWVKPMYYILYISSNYGPRSEICHDTDRGSYNLPPSLTSPFTFPNLCTSFKPSPSPPPHNQTVRLSLKPQVSMIPRYNWSIII